METTPAGKIIVALDNIDDDYKLERLIKDLAPLGVGFKVGLELIARGLASWTIKLIHESGGWVFYDGKFNDIPNTVKEATRAVVDKGVRMFDVHASSGIESMVAAVKGKGKSKTLVLAVTVLTSLDYREVPDIFGKSVILSVLHFAYQAKKAGCDGIICSAQDLAIFKPYPDLQKLTKVTPGIRPVWAKSNDQKRFLTPKEAIEAGADYLVIGRPITNPPKEIGSPQKALEEIIAEIE